MRLVDRLEPPLKQVQFEQVAVPHMAALYKNALRLTGNPDDAHDLLQDTYLRAFRFWDKFEKGTNIKAWLYRIMKNSYLNIYRKKVRTPIMIEFDDTHEVYGSGTKGVSVGLSGDGTIDINSLRNKIYDGVFGDDIARAMESLPDDFRDVVILSDIAGLSYVEITEQVHCPIGTIRSRLHRARKILRKKLLSYAHDNGYIRKNMRA